MEPKGSRRAPSGRHRLGRGPAWEQARCPRGGTAERGFPGSVGTERLGRAEWALAPPGRQAAGSWVGRGGQHGGPATQRPAGPGELEAGAGQRVVGVSPWRGLTGTRRVLRAGTVWGRGGPLGRQVLCGALQDAPCTPGVCVKVPAWAVASSPHAELRDQPPCGGGTVPAPAGSPLAGGFLLEPSGLSTGLLPGPGEPEDTLFLLVFKAMGALAATPGSQPCGAHVGTLEPTAVRLGGRLGSLDLRVCACKWGCWCLAHGVLVRED